MSKHISLPRSRMWRTRAATALAAAGALVMSGGMVMLAAPAATADPDPRVVVCKYVSTPGGELDHVIIVSENSLNNTPYVAPPNGDSWTDAHGQSTEGSVAIRYATEGEQAKDVKLSECPGGSDDDACDELAGNQGPSFPCTKDPTERKVERSESGCNVQGPEGAVGGTWTWTDVYTTTYEFDEVNQEWVGTEGPAVAGTKTWTPFTAQERIRYECDETTTDDACPQLGGIQPAGFQCSKGPDTSAVPKRLEGCDVQGPNGLLGGVQTWNEVTTTTYSFNEQTQQWVGSTTGPVVQGQQFVPYTAAERLANGCDEILGVQEIAPKVSFTDPTCENLDRAKWSGNLTDLVDYTVSGTPGRGNSVTVTANIKPAVTDQFAFPDGFDNTFDHSYPSKADLDCPTVKGSESSRPKPHKTPTVLGTQAVAPTAVDAGLASLPGDSGTSTTSLLAQLMVAGGLLLLLAGGWLGLGRREDGAHQA